jgi:caffeoyl-CoA O-methyltransferase
MLDHDPKMEEYCIANSESLPDFLAELWSETHEKTNQPRMLSGPLQGAFLRFITRLTGAKRILEVGTFTGYSALCMALGLPSDGEVITLESDERMRTFHQKYFTGEYGKKVKVIYGDAKKTITQLTGSFDLAFIDADKKGYLHYYEAILPMLKSGGLILADNVLWSGRVYNEDDESNTIALREFNEKVAADKRVEPFLLYLRDGVMMLRKK